MSTYKFKTKSCDIDLKRLIKEVGQDVKDNSYIFLKVGNNNYIIVQSTFYFTCKQLQKYNFQYIKQQSCFVEDEFMQVYGSDTFFMIYKIPGYQLELFKGSIKQWYSNTLKGLYKEVSVKVTTISKHENTKPTKPKKKRTSIHDYLLTLKNDHPKYEEIFNKCINIELKKYIKLNSK